MGLALARGLPRALAWALPWPALTAYLPGPPAPGCAGALLPPAGPWCAVAAQMPLPPLGPIGAVSMATIAVAAMTEQRPVIQTAAISSSFMARWT